MKKTNTNQSSPVIENKNVIFEIYQVTGKVGNSGKTKTIHVGKQDNVYSSNDAMDYAAMFHGIGEITSITFGRLEKGIFTNSPTPSSPVIDTGKHTPGEWIYHYSKLLEVHYIKTDGKDIAVLGQDKEAKANAKRIVHCVNNFDELVEALHDLVYGNKAGMGKKAMALRFEIAWDILQNISPKKQVEDLNEEE